MAIEELERGQKHTIYHDPARPGWRRAMLTVHDQHYQDEADQWQPVVESLEADRRLPGFSRRLSGARHALWIGDDGTRRWYPRRNIGTEYVEFGRLQYRDASNQWVDLPLGTPTGVNGGTITWDRPNYTLTLSVNWRRVKLNVVLKDSTAARPLRWPISLVGLTRNGERLVGRDGAVVGWLDKPVAWDTNGSHDAPHIPVNLAYQGGYVVFTADLSTAVFPVTIDPTLTLQPDSAGKDTYIGLSTPDGNFGGSNWLDVFEDFFGNRNYALLQFDLSPLSGATIQSATLSLYLSGGVQSVQYYTIYLQQMLVPWTEDGATYNTSDGSTPWPGSAGARTEGTDYDATVDGTVVVTTPAKQEGDELQFVVTPSRLQSMVAANNGWRLRITPGKGEVPASSDDNSNPHPKLVVDYTTGTNMAVAVAAAASTSVPAPRLTRRIAVSVGGSGVVSPIVRVTRRLGAAASALAAVSTPTIRLNRRLVAASAGSGAVAAALSGLGARIVNLGTVAIGGAAAATAAMQRYRGLRAITGGISTAATAMRRYRGLRVTSGGQTSVAARIRGITALRAAPSGMARVVARLVGGSRTQVTATLSPVPSPSATLSPVAGPCAEVTV